MPPPRDGLPRKRPRPCAVCRHDERSRIEMLSISGVSFERLAERFGLHKDAVWRHMNRHVTAERRASYLIGPQRIQELVETASEESASTLDHYRVLRSTLFHQLDRLAEKRDHHGVNCTANVLNSTLKHMARMTGELREFGATTLNIQNIAVLNSGPMAALQAGLLDVCSEVPEARAPIVRLLRRLDEQFTSPLKTIDASSPIDAETGSRANV